MECFSAKKMERDPPIFNNMYKPWAHYANEISQTEKRIVWYNTYVESKKFKSVKNRVKYSLPEVVGQRNKSDGI